MGGEQRTAHKSWAELHVTLSMTALVRGVDPYTSDHLQLCTVHHGSLEVYETLPCIWLLARSGQVMQASCCAGYKSHLRQCAHCPCSQTHCRLYPAQHDACTVPSFPATAEICESMKLAMAESCMTQKQAGAQCELLKRSGLCGPHL